MEGRRGWWWGAKVGQQEIVDREISVESSRAEAWGLRWQSSSIQGEGDVKDRECQAGTTIRHHKNAQQCQVFQKQNKRNYQAVVIGLFAAWYHKKNEKRKKITFTMYICPLPPAYTKLIKNTLSLLLSCLHPHRHHLEIVFANKVRHRQMSTWNQSFQYIDKQQQHIGPERIIKR